MEQTKLIDRVVVEIMAQDGTELTARNIANQLRMIADEIEESKKGGNYADIDWTDESRESEVNFEVLWEHESSDCGGFRMGNRSLVRDTYYGAKEFFEVCSVSKEDIEKQGFDASKLTNEEMERIASKMNDLVCEGCDYWNAVDGACEYWKVPKKEEEDDPRLTPQQRKELGYE